MEKKRMAKRMELTVSFPGKLHHNKITSEVGIKGKTESSSGLSA